MILYFDKIDLFFNLLHIIVILINSLGWVFNITLRPSLYLIIITLFCWTFLGIFQGIGFCPLTYMHSQYLYTNYEFRLPFSYLDYLLINNFNLPLTSKMISITSVLVIFISLIINLKKNNLNSLFFICLALINTFSWSLIIFNHDIGTKINIYNMEIIFSSIITLVLLIYILKKIITFRVNFFRLKYNIFSDGYKSKICTKPNWIPSFGCCQNSNF